MIQVLERAFAILEELNLNGELSLEKLAQLNQLNKGTLCNILRTLIALGYVRRCGVGRYGLTEKAGSFAWRIDTELNAKLKHTAEALAEITDESVVIATLRGSKVAIIAQAQKPRELMINTGEVYAALSLYHSVSGRVLVAELEPAERDALFATTGAPGAEWDDIATVEELERACRGIRQSGYSMMKNSDLGIVSIAVATTVDNLKLSIGLTAPLIRCPQKKLLQIRGTLRQVAEKLATK